MAFNPVDVELVKDAADIISVIQRYVQLKRSGSSWKGLCPFHKEKTPSFHVFPGRGTFKCFGCGEGGDVISFLMKQRNLTFLEVVEELAEENGITLKLTPSNRGSADRRAALYSLLEEAQKFFLESFNEQSGTEARNYLKSRQLEQFPDVIGIGYAPGSNACIKHLEKLGYSVSSAVEAGMVITGKGTPYDRFRNRLTFPIRDRRGRVVSFGARTLDDSIPKYLNGPETDVYRKGSFLYGYSFAQKSSRDKGRAILVEGYFDHARLYSAGFIETVATSGTALTPKQARNLIGMGDSVFICYDGDKAGHKASVKAAEVILAQGGYPKIIKLPDNCDPDDYILQKGSEGFSQLMESAADPITFCVSLLDGFPHQGPERTRITRRLLQVASSAADPLIEEDLRGRIEKITGYSRDTLQKAMGEIRGNRTASTRSKGSSNLTVELTPGDRAILKASTSGGRIDRELVRFLKMSDMNSETGHIMLKELVSQLEKGYSSVVFGEMSEKLRNISADLVGSLEPISNAERKRLMESVERKRREKPRRQALCRKLGSANREEQALILEDLNDSGGFHER